MHDRASIQRTQTQPVLACDLDGVARLRDDYGWVGICGYARRLHHQAIGESVHFALSCSDGANHSAHNMDSVLLVRLGDFAVSGGVGTGAGRGIRGQRRNAVGSHWRFQSAGSRSREVWANDFLAGYLSHYHDNLRQSPNRILVPLALVFIVCALVVAEPDLGSAAVVLAATLSVLFMAGAKLRFVLLMVVGGALLFALMVWLEPFRMRRMAAFTDPWAVPFDTGYQLVQALIAFGRGELLGLGLGEGIQKLSYLPEAHNDFIFAVIAEELGSIGAIALIVLYTFFVALILSVAKRSLQTGNLFAGYCCYFVGFIFAYQFLVNVGVNVGVLPTKGLTLPFISYGGNSLMVSCALFAFVLRCSWAEDMAPVTSRKSSVGR